MKAIAALIIVGALSPSETAASGIIIGVVLIVLALTGAIGWLVRVVPTSVIIGVQMAVGVQLAIIGVEHVVDTPWYGGLALAALVGLYFTRFRSFAAILVIAAAVLAGLWISPPTAAASYAFHWLGFAWPAMEDFKRAAYVAVLPQLAMTLSNAILVTATLAGEYFPAGHGRAGAPRLAVGTGLFNILTAPFGAIPMCHGAGGLVAQYGFGARSWRTPVIFGLSCLLLVVAFGGGAGQILNIISIGAVGALLVFAGTEMTLTRRFLDVKPSCKVVVAVTLVVSISANMAAGLAVGLLAEWIRSALQREAATDAGRRA